MQSFISDCIIYLKCHIYTHSFIHSEREREISRQGWREVGWTSSHMTTWRSPLPPSSLSPLGSVFTSCCMQLPPQRVGESRRKMRAEERWDLQLPHRVWRRKNVLWDGVEDLPLLRTREERDLDLDISEEAFFCAEKEEFDSEESSKKTPEMRVTSPTRWIVRGWMTCVLVSFYAQVNTRVVLKTWYFI